MNYLKYAHSFEVIAELPEPLRPLEKLAMNFHWTWHYPTKQLFQEIDQKLWKDVHHNPHALLLHVSRDRLNRLAEDETYIKRLKAREEEFEAYLSGSNWFDRAYPGQREHTQVAYFCAEFGLNECLPIYSGGLGVLAGDHLKAASDLGIPMVGVGLVYSKGYFRQFLSPEGWQQEYYPEIDFFEMPLQLMRGEDHEPIHIEIEFPDHLVRCQIWRAKVGRIPLYLLDSNILENEPYDQGITDTLYGGDEEMRIRQEIILGIGGVRALEKLGICPTAYHMNEGHAAFLTLERLRQIREQHNCSFQMARQVVVSSNIFTTHTPVPAGFDLFSNELLRKYFSSPIERAELSFDSFLSLGRFESENKEEPFNMAVLAMRNASYINGVSKLHSTVSQKMFHPLWHKFPVDEVPIAHITNGIHTLSWISPYMGYLLDRHLGTKWREEPSNPNIWKGILEIPNIEIWDLREDMRGEFVRYCRKRLQRRSIHRATKPLTPSEAAGVLDSRALTIGFARRFATYKRGNLLFRDPERLKRILNHSERPVQIIFSGKSHPKDEAGKRLIQEIASFINEGDGRKKILFLEDYDMSVARNMVRGVDLWLNTPRRPYEASGTSGMKVVPNGGLNCSILDGWWAEGYSPKVGWAIGDMTEHEDYDYQDWLDSLSIYQLLETEIPHRFYNRGEDGIPHDWVKMIKQSMCQLIPFFSTDRMIQEYATKAYLEASQAFHRMQNENLSLAGEVLEWKKRIQSHWHCVKVENVQSGVKRVNKLGKTFQIQADIQLGELHADDVSVQAIAGRVGANRELMGTKEEDLEYISFENGLHRFEGTLSCSESGHRGYIVRVLPKHRHVHIPMELPLVAWEQGHV